MKIAYAAKKNSLKSAKDSPRRVLADDPRLVDIKWPIAADAVARDT